MGASSFVEGVMGDGLDDIAVDFAEQGVVKVRQLDKRVLSHGGGWATIAFHYEEKDPDGDGFKPPKIALRRYRKRGDRWVVDTRFVVSSGEQARGLADAIATWFPPETPPAR